jgi:phosphatidylglycerol:prolipoprotein diacylglycerol transferase
MEVYIHNLSPFAIRFTEDFGIRWYGLAYLSGFVLGYIALRLVYKYGRSPLTPDKMVDFVTYCAIGVLGGGRLGYCLFYAPELFFKFDEHFPFWGVFKVNEGGMSSHGGIIGVMLVCYFFGRANKISILHLMDLVVFGGSLAFFFGRIANFINGELYGRAAPAGYAWAVKFPQEMYLWSQQQITKLFDLGPAADALGTLKTPDGPVPLDSTIWQGWVQNFTQDVGAHNAVLRTIDQLIAAVQNGNAKVVSALAPVLTARYPSQLFQAVLEGLLVFIILSIIWIKPRKPGVLGAMFGVLYSIARIVGEQYRMPDPQIGFQLWGLTRGQWLSFGLLAVAIAFVIWAARRDAEPMGGFSRPREK